MRNRRSSVAQKGLAGLPRRLMRPLANGLRITGTSRLSHPLFVGKTCRRARDRALPPRGERLPLLIAPKGDSQQEHGRKRKAALALVCPALGTASSSLTSRSIIRVRWSHLNSSTDPVRGSLRDSQLHQISPRYVVYLVSWAFG